MIAAVHDITSRRAHARLLCAALLAAAGVTACSSSKSSSATTTAPVQSKAGAGPTVNTVGLAFQPQEVTAKAGQAVTWMTTDGTAHNIVDDDGAFSNGAIKTGTSFSHTYDSPGTFKFHCSIHPTMTGTVTVTA
jgi:plastocyanin